MQVALFLDLWWYVAAEARSRSGGVCASAFGGPRSPGCAGGRPGGHDLFNFGSCMVAVSSECVGQVQLWLLEQLFYISVP
jgi:hypothetical protein